MAKIIAQNLKRHGKSYLGLLAELSVLLVVFNALLGSLVPFLQSKAAYRKLDLSDIVCVTAYTDWAGMREIASQNGLTLLWQDMESCQALNPYGDESIQVQPVDESYFDKFDYSYSSRMDELPEGDWAVVSGSLKRQYKTGQTYDLTLENGQTVSFTVYAALKNDYMFIPPSESSSSDVISDCPNTLLMVFNEEMPEIFEETYVYTLEAGSEEEAEGASEELYSFSAVTAAMAAQEGYEEQNSSDASLMGIPIILAIAAAFLCLAAMIADVLLKNALNERNNGIYYICGFTWAKCSCVQIFSDAVIFLAALAVSFIAVILLGNMDFNIFYFLISALSGLVICALAELLGVIRMRKKDAVMIVERTR